MFRHNGAPETRPQDQASDPFDTALISRLANEIFAGSHRPQAPKVPLAEPQLASPDPTGGFPLASPATHPPVHPVLPTGSSRASPLERGPASGAHDPSNENSHFFGEPRCNGSSATASRQLPSKREPSVSGLPDSSSESQFYFLRESPSKQALNRSAGYLQPPTFSGSELESIRRDFPALHQRVHGKPLIWLDNAATTHKPQSVIDATSRFYSRDNSNIHRAAHALASRSTELFESSREKVRQFLGASDKKEIVFVRGTTEAINLVAQSYGRKHIGAGDEIIVSQMEHHANIVPWQLLAGQVGAKLRVIPINDRGELILEEFIKLLGSRTKFVSVTHVSNSLGTINPIEEIIALAHGRGVPVLIDGAQSTPHLPVNVQASNADFYVFSGHKVFGPTGIGALYGKAALLEEMPPWQGGGHMIEDVRFEKSIFREAPEKFEAGTPDIAGVVGLGAALDYLLQIGLPAIAAYEHELLEYATAALSKVPGLKPIGTALNKASILGFVIPGIPNEKIARHLDQQGIAVRAGHHCALPSLRHFGQESTVRPSLAFYNTHSEVDALAEALRRISRPAKNENHPSW